MYSGRTTQVQPRSPPLADDQVRVQPDASFGDAVSPSLQLLPQVEPARRAVLPLGQDQIPVTEHGLGPPPEPCRLQLPQLLFLGCLQQFDVDPFLTVSKTSA